MDAPTRARSAAGPVVARRRAGITRYLPVRSPQASLRRSVTWALRPLPLGILALVAFGLWSWQPIYRYDEYLVAVARTQLPWPDLVRVIATSDPGAGPLYVLMKPWTAISSDPWWTRLPSVFAMAVAVMVLVALARRFLDVTAAAFAGVLMIVLPSVTRWAQDNRMYALATACVVLAVLCWWLSLERRSWRWSVAFGAAVVGMGLMHLYTLAMLPAIVLATRWLPGRGTLIRTLAPIAVALVALAPHIYLNMATPTGSPTNPPATAVFIAALPVLDLGGVFVAPLMLWLALGGALWGWQARALRPFVVLAVTWALVPLVIFVAARALLGVPTLVARYYVFTIPAWCLLAALGLMALRAYRRPAASLALATVALLAIPQHAVVRSAGGHDEAMHSLRLVLETPELSGLPVVPASRASAVVVSAAMYPRLFVADAQWPRQPVAVVVLSRPGAGPGPAAAFLESSPWQPVLTCRLEDRVVIQVVAVPGSQLPAGGAAGLAQRLNANAPGARCAADP